MKDDTYLELPSKRKGLTIIFCGKITTISCRIDMSDCNHLSNNLIFQTPVSNGRTFFATQRFNQFNLAIKSNELLTNAHSVT